MTDRRADLGDFEVQERAFAVASARVQAGGGFVNPYTVWYVGRMLAADRARCDAILGRRIELTASPLAGVGLVPDFTNVEMEFLRAYDESAIEAHERGRDTGRRKRWRGWSL